MPARRTPLIRTLVVSGLLVGGMAVAGCGGSGDSPAAATTAPAATTTPATSELNGLTAKEVFDKNRWRRKRIGQHPARALRVTRPIEIDMVLKADGGGAGSIGLSGSTFEIVVNGQDMYFKADDAFYRNSLGDGYTAEVAALIGGKFLKGSVTDPRLADFANFGDLNEFMQGTLSPEGDISRIDGKTINGVPTVGLHDDDPDDGGSLFVADDGTNLPVAIEPDQTKGESGQITSPSGTPRSRLPCRPRIRSWTSRSSAETSRLSCDLSPTDPSPTAREGSDRRALPRAAGHRDPRARRASVSRALQP